MNKTQTGRIPALFFVSGYVLIFSTAFLALAVGAVLPDITAEFSLSYEQSGLFLSLLSIGNMGALAVGGYLSDLIGKRAVISGGAAIMAASLAVILMVPSEAALFPLIFICGLGWGATGMINGAVTEATGGSATHLNRLHMSLAAGALSAPFYAILAVNMGGWRMVVGTVAVMLAVSAVLTFVGLRKMTAHKTGERPRRAQWAPFMRPRYYVFVVMMFSYAACESVMNGWVTTYFKGTEILTHMEANIVLSLVWAAILGGRIAASVIGGRVKKELMLIICGGLLLLTAVAVMRADSFAGAAVCVVGIGLGLSALFPTAMASAAPVLGGSGAAMGIMLGFAGFGAATSPATAGMIAERTGLSYSMWALVGFATLLLVKALVHLLFGRHHSD